LNDNFVLSVKNLKKRYGDVTAVDGIDFTVGKGEIFGLLGPNGAGKTTTIRILCGLVRADSGEITLNGISMATGYAKIKSSIGFCPQDIVVWELLTCIEQLKLTGVFYGLTPKRARARAEDLLHQFGLWE
jgi:ABC-2 type transport system ATP-binding protein